MGTSESTRLIKVGRVAGAFGVKGEVRITAFTEDPKALIKFGALLREDGSPGLTVAAGRAQKGAVVVRVDDITTPEQADALRGLQLFVPREIFPEPDEDEFYLADLIGLAAVAPDGKPLGRIKSVRDFGAGDILEIQPPTGSSWFVAVTRETVPEVRLAAGEVVVDRPSEVSDKDTL